MQGRDSAQYQVHWRDRLQWETTVKKDEVLAGILEVHTVLLNNKLNKPELADTLPNDGVILLGR
jgi:hypothetical protein